MKKLLHIFQISTIIALSTSLTLSAASTSYEQENMFTDLVRLNARQIALTMIINEHENKIPNGIDPKKIINQALTELDENATKMKTLEQQLVQAGFEQDIIQRVVQESLFNQLTNEQLEQIAAFVHNL